MAEKKIEIRDTRDGKFLWIGKEALKFLSEKTDSTSIAVYSWLCYYAHSKAQNCFPSITTLANHCNVSSRTVMRKLKRLEKLNVILIERTEGKSNVYKLLDVVSCGKEAVDKTSDIGVTGDMHVRGVVTPMSPPVVTPVSPEQYLTKQDLNNKTVVFGNLFCGKLPYAKPDQETIKALEELSRKFLGEVNLLKFILGYKFERGYPPHPDVIIKTCNQYQKDKPKIRNVESWFKTVVEAESAQFFANQNITEHRGKAKEFFGISSGKKFNESF